MRSFFTGDSRHERTRYFIPRRGRGRRRRPRCCAEDRRRVQQAVSGLAMKAAVVTFVSTLAAALAAQLLATYLVNNVRPVRRLVGAL